MKSLVVSALLATSAAGWAAEPAPTHAHDQQHQHQHDHGHTGDAMPAHDPAQRWPADAVLRDSMQRIHDSRLHMAETPSDAALAPAMADTIDGAIRSMIEGCKLPPDADAVLHGMIGRLGAASARLRSGDSSALHDIDGVLDEYPQRFEHHGWSVGH